MFSPLDGVDTVLAVNAVQQVGGVIRGRYLLLVDDIHTGLVKGHRIGRGQDAVVFQFHRCGMIHAVAIDAHVVHHADEDDALLPVEVVHHSLRGSSHRLEESVLVADVFGSPEFSHVEFLHLACRVDIGLAVTAGTPDGQVLERTAVAAHGVTFEMTQQHHEVVVGHVASHDVILDVRLVLDGNTYLVVLVHDIHGEVLQETVTLDDFPVVGRSVALVLLIARSAAIGGIAFHNGAVHLKDQILDEFGLQVVGVTALTRRDLHCHAALGLNAKRLVDFHQRLRRNVPCHIYRTLSVRCDGHQAHQHQ